MPNNAAAPTKPSKPPKGAKPRYSTKRGRRANLARANAKRRPGRPSGYSIKIANNLCRLIAAGMKAIEACEELGIPERTFYFWLLDHPEFLQSYERARDIRANAAFAEQQLEIADNVSDDWSFNPDSGKLSVKKEAMLRSKLRIETRQWQMARRHPQEWGDRQQIDVRNDWSLLTEEERRRKSEELIAMIEEIRNPPPGPPPLVYRPEEPPEDDDQQQRGIGWKPRTLTGRES
jgi:terminase small subunit-like protein